MFRSAVFGTVVAGFTLSGSALAAISGTTYSIDPMAMIPDSPSSASSYTNNWTGFLANNGYNKTSCFNTGINLPQYGAIIKISVIFQSVAKSNPTVYIVRHNTFTGESTPLVDRMLLDDSGTRVTKFLLFPAETRYILNETFSYGFGICLGAGDMFFGAKILYQ